MNPEIQDGQPENEVETVVPPTKSAEQGEIDSARMTEEGKKVTDGGWYDHLIG